MPDYHGSSNPFRRKGRAAPVQGSDDPEVNTRESSVWQPPIDGSTSRPDGVGRSAGKVVKHVRVQSPPPSSPEDNEIPRGDEDHPKLAQGDEGRVLGYDPFEPVLTDESSDDPEEEESLVSGGVSAGAPRNPFSKTLATLEGTEAKELGSDSPSISAGKPVMDVEAFKQLLMTGNSGPAAPAITSTVPAASAPAGLTDGSSTEASSVSWHSIFESLQDSHSGSPRTSQEISEEERKGIPNLKRSASERKKPPPPNSRHGKLINVQLKDEKPRPQSLYSPYTANPGFSSHSTLSIAQSIASTNNHRSTTDLNKPLPPRPLPHKPRLRPRIHLRHRSRRQDARAALAHNLHAPPHRARTPRRPPPRQPRLRHQHPAGELEASLHYGLRGPQYLRAGPAIPAHRQGAPAAPRTQARLDQERAHDVVVGERARTVERDDGGAACAAAGARPVDASGEPAGVGGGRGREEVVDRAAAATAASAEGLRQE